MAFRGGRGGRGSGRVGYGGGGQFFYGYAEDLKSCVRNCDGDTLASFFSLTRSPRQLLLEMGNRNIENECWKVLGEMSDIAEVYILLLQGAVFLSQGNALDAYKQQTTLLTKFMDVMKEQDFPWMMQTLHRIVEDTRTVAIEADKEVARTKGHSDNDNLRDCERLLKLAFTFCVTDRKSIRDQESKKSGFLHIVVVLFKTYFQLNTLRLCKNIIKSITRPGFVGEEDCFAKSDLVTYKYYVGRLYMFEDNYAEAEAALSWSLRHCHARNPANKVRVLNYLVPVKLARGRLPTPALLRRYGLAHFEGLVGALRRGDLRGFNRALDAHQALFIAHGTYLILEKLKVLVYRNLFKKIHLLLGKHQIQLAYFARALRWLEVPMEMDEIECVLANLIYKGFLKGYISHTSKVLVLSKKGDAFPFSAIVQ